MARKKRSEDNLDAALTSIVGPPASPEVTPAPTPEAPPPEAPTTAVATSTIVITSPVPISEDPPARRTLWDVLLKENCSPTAKLDAAETLARVGEAEGRRSQELADAVGRLMDPPSDARERVRAARILLGIWK